MFHLGFTGTRRGLTRLQYDTIIELLEDLPEELTLHHGDCVGADEAMDRLVRYAKPGVVVVGHIPASDRLRAFCEFDEVHKPKPYLDRDKDIVAHSELLIAAPATSYEVMRSGTWATIRHSRKLNKERRVVDPLGKITGG